MKTKIANAIGIFAAWLALAAALFHWADMEPWAVLISPPILMGGSLISLVLAGLVKLDEVVAECKTCGSDCRCDDQII